MLSQDVHNHIFSCNEPHCLCNTIDVPYLYKTLREELPLIPHELQAQRPDNSRALPDAWLHLEPFTRKDFLGKPCGKFLGYTCWLCRSVGGKAGATRLLGSRLETNAKKFRRFVLLRHQRSDRHKNSVRVLLGQEPQTKPIKRESGTPSIERFLDTLQAIRKLKFSALRREEGGLGHRKTRKMVWCLAESLKQLYRNQLRQAVTINILRDERHKRLQGCWRSCDEKMSLNRGGFGIIKSHDSGACGNAEGTRKLIENFCTKFYDPPDAPKSCAQPTLDVSLLRHIQNVTEAITIDAASCEVASARDLTSSSSFTAE